MDNKDRNKHGMEEKRSNSHIRADKELDKILCKQPPEIFLFYLQNIGVEE
jgi:hypothetical protein